MQYRQWSMVSFLRKLPNLTPAQYKAMDKQAGPMKMEEGNED